MSDYYKMLGVTPGADDEVVDAAYHALMKKYHPDRNRGNTVWADVRAKEINHAYAAIRNFRRAAGKRVSVVPSASGAQPPALAAQRTPPLPKSGSPIGWLIGIGVGLFVLFKIAGAPDPNRATTDETVELNVMEPVITPVEVPEPALADVHRAARHAGLALGAEGAEGAQIYSQACFASLERKFSWSKLDQCGSFDALVIRTETPAELGSLGEWNGWFTAEAAQARYDSAAKAGGSDQPAADSRQSALLMLANREPVSRVVPPGSVMDSIEEDSGSADEAELDETIETELANALAGEE